MISDAERKQKEDELTTAILLLWLLFEDEFTRTGTVAYDFFLAGFNQYVRPILAYVYGTARNDLASNFGYQYQTRVQNGQAIVTIPNLFTTVERWARDLYDGFIKRVSGAPHQRQRTTQPEPEDEPERPTCTESDASRFAVTTVTAATSEGEYDAAADVEANVGTRLIPYWIAQTGACSICGPLHNQPERVWRRVYPRGCPGHPNCRCRLQWRELLT